MSELTDKNIKIFIITIFHMIQKLSRDTDYYKYTQIKLLQIKITMCELKILLIGLIQV